MRPALATQDIYAKEGLLTRAATLSSPWENAMHSLRGLPHVIDIRNYGLIGAVEEPRQGKPGHAALMCSSSASNGVSWCVKPAIPSPWRPPW